MPFQTSVRSKALNNASLLLAQGVCGSHDSLTHIFLHTSTVFKRNNINSIFSICKYELALLP